MSILSVNFAPFIPTTILGLAALLLGYLYSYFSEKNKNEIESLKDIAEKDRLEAYKSRLGDLGVTYDTSKLTPDGMRDLIIATLKERTKRYLIGSITLIILAIIFAFVFKKDAQKPDPGPILPIPDSTKTVTTNFFLDQKLKINNLQGAVNYESKLKDELLNLFTYQTYSQDYSENSDWGEILYSLAATSKIIQENRFFFKKTPMLENEFGQLDNIVTNLRNKIAYNVYSTSFQIFPHWDKYGKDKSAFIDNLPKRQIIGTGLLKELNVLRNNISTKITSIRKI